MDREEDRFTQEIVDPVTGKEYTVNVYPYSWGYKYDVRDNEQGTVVQDVGMRLNFGVAMHDAQQWIETRDKEAAANLFVSVTLTRDGYIAGVAYPDSVVSLASTDPAPTYKDALKHGEALLSAMQAQEQRQGGRTQQDVDDNGRVFSWIESCRENDELER